MSLFEFASLRCTLEMGVFKMGTTDDTWLMPSAWQVAAAARLTRRSRLAVCVTDATAAALTDE